jgi:MFS family permease
VFPLALAQFVASYAGTNMNVAISTIASDIGTTVIGMQTVITLFTLTMAALMIPGSKLTDIWGRKRCFLLGLIIYGSGAVLAAFAHGLGLMVVGYSLLEGVGSALLIPPIYILITVAFTETRERAKYFGAVSGAAGLGAAAGPLIGGLVTSAIAWQASFVLQAAIVALIIVLARGIVDPPRSVATPHFDLGGAVLSALGLVFVVIGILQSSTYGWFAAREAFIVGGKTIIPKGGVSPVWLFVAIGAVILLWFYVHIRRVERKNGDPLIASRLFKNHLSNRGLGTQLIQWLILQGTFFVISVYLQKVHNFSAIQTGLMLSPAIVGILLSSAAAGRLARRHTQVWLVRVGFIVTTTGMGLVLLLGGLTSSIWALIPGLLLIGLGVGVMLTSSVNVVQSAFPERDQGDISGLSRCLSNLGSSLGTALAGSLLAAASHPGGRPFLLSLTLMIAISLIGLGLAFALREPQPTARPAARSASS